MAAANWDSVVGSAEQWASLDSQTFEQLEDIKGMQCSISTNALFKLLCHLGQPLTHNTNLCKPNYKVAERIVALETHPGWEEAALSNMHLASSVRDASEASTIAFHLELSGDTRSSVFPSWWGGCSTCNGASGKGPALKCRCRCSWTTSADDDRFGSGAGRHYPAGARRCSSHR